MATQLSFMDGCVNAGIGWTMTKNVNHVGKPCPSPEILPAPQEKFNLA